MVVLTGEVTCLRPTASKWWSWDFNPGHEFKDLVGSRVYMRRSDRKGSQNIRLKPLCKGCVFVTVFLECKVWLGSIPIAFSYKVGALSSWLSQFSPSVPFCVICSAAYFIYYIKMNY